MDDTTIVAVPVRTPGARGGAALRVTMTQAAGSASLQPCVWRLPHTHESARTARRIAALVLFDCGETDQDTIEAVQLVVSEMVTNAVEHALPPVVLYVYPDNAAEDADESTVHIEVTDGGPASDEGEWTASCAADEHGRGDGIIDSLARSRGIRSRDHGATRWVDMPAGEEPAFEQLPGPDGD